MSSTNFKIRRTHVILYKVIGERKKRRDPLATPDGVTKIGEYVFSGCTGLTSVVIPGGVGEIKNFDLYA